MKTRHYITNPWDVRQKNGEAFPLKTDSYCISLHAAALCKLDNNFQTNDLFIRLTVVKKLIIKMQHVSLFIISMQDPH